jgi:hypothetical protein
LAETDIKRTDYEPYFDMWDSVLHYPNPEIPKSQHQKIHGYTGDLGSVPCYQHKTCGGLVLLGAFGNGKYPPRVCPECSCDTSKEITNPNEREPKLIIPGSG